MPYYILVASGRPEIQVDTLKFSDEVTLSTKNPVELDEGGLADATEFAAKVGYRLAEVGEPQSEESGSQPTGSDVAGMSPVVDDTGSGPEINQQAEENLEHDVGSRPAQGDQAGSETTGTTGFGTGDSTTDTL